MKKTTMVALALAAFAMMAIAPAAGAHKVKYETTITAKLKKGGKDAGTFEGAVESPKAKCVMDRKVKLYQVVDNADDALLGVDRTDDAGAWEILVSGELAAGDYYALAAKQTLKKSKKHRHVCKRAASELITVK